MVASELTTSILADYLRVDSTDGLDMYLESAKAYVKDYTGLDDGGLDTSDGIAICILAVASDLYDNRQTQVGVNNSYINRTIASLLSMHSTNLLPSE